MTPTAQGGALGRLWRLLRSRPRLWIAAAAGTLVGALAGELPLLDQAAAPLIGWNAFALTYLALAWHMVSGTASAQVRERAHSQHEGRYLVLALGLAAVLWSLLAIASQLAELRSLKGMARSLPLAVVLLTVATSWLFTQVLFALHYAHSYYVAHAQTDGHRLMDFPGTQEPDYGDFLYAACVIGTSAQTADVAFTDSRVRRVATLHCVIAFLFNTVALALGVNLAASLF